MFAALFFDLDGTLIDSELLWVEAVACLTREAGLAAPRQEILELVYGRSWSDIFADMGRHYPALPTDYAAMSRVIQRHYRRLRRGRDLRIAGSVEALISLAERYPIAIVSGSTGKDIRDAVERLALRPYLRFYLGCEEYAPGKPHPACYLTAAARMGVDPARCLVFEDSAHGVQAAKAAGMTCVALRRPETPSQDLSAADAIVHDLRACVNGGLVRLPQVGDADG